MFDQPIAHDDFIASHTHLFSVTTFVLVTVWHKIAYDLAKSPLQDLRLCKYPPMVQILLLLGRFKREQIQHQQAPHLTLLVFIQSLDSSLSSKSRINLAISGRDGVAVSGRASPGAGY